MTYAKLIIDINSPNQTNQIEMDLTVEEGDEPITIVIDHNGVTTTTRTKPIIVTQEDELREPR